MNYVGIFLIAAILGFFTYPVLLKLCTGPFIDFLRGLSEKRK